LLAIKKVPQTNRRSKFKAPKIYIFECVCGCFYLFIFLFDFFFFIVSSFAFLFFKPSSRFFNNHKIAAL